MILLYFQVPKLSIEVVYILTKINWKHYSSCSGSSTSTGSCNSQCCQTTNGGWGSWSSWGSCSCNHATGTGTWTRSRTCNNPAPSCGGRLVKYLLILG